MDEDADEGGYSVLAWVAALSKSPRLAFRELMDALLFAPKTGFGSCSCSTAYIDLISF